MKYNFIFVVKAIFRAKKEGTPPCGRVPLFVDNSEVFPPKVERSRESGYKSYEYAPFQLSQVTLQLEGRWSTAVLGTFLNEVAMVAGAEVAVQFIVVKLVQL